MTTSITYLESIFNIRYI